MRRFWIAIAAVLIVVPGVWTSTSSSSHAATLVAKKTCHYVTKKAHGKKKQVKVCKTLKPRSTLSGPAGQSKPSQGLGRP
jgi:hypothetical protein